MNQVEFILLYVFINWSTVNFGVSFTAVFGAVVILFKLLTKVLGLADTPIPGPKQEVIVFVGLPGCGKTKLANELAEKHDYATVNRDSMKTWQKCVEATKVYLKRGKSVIVDNTNCDMISRYVFF